MNLLHYDTIDMSSNELKGAGLRMARTGVTCCMCASAAGGLLAGAQHQGFVESFESQKINRK